MYKNTTILGLIFIILFSFLLGLSIFALIYEIKENDIPFIILNIINIIMCSANIYFGIKIKNIGRNKNA